MAMYQLSNEDTVLVYGADIGGIDKPSVKKLLKYSGESEWSPELKDYIEDWYYEYDRCPICGRKQFHYHREILPGVRVGFCLHCKEDMLNKYGDIEHLRSGKVGVLVEHNKLYPTPKMPKIILSYSGSTK